MGRSTARTTTSRSRARHSSAQLPLDSSHRARLVVVADSHGRPHPASGALIAAEEPVAILHGGDIGGDQVIDELAAIAPVYAVRGNIDHRSSFPDSMDISIGPASDPRLRILLTHVAVYGPRLRADAAALAKEHGASLVVCGHSHVPFIGRDRGLTMFNPGSIGPRRFGLPIVFGVIDLTPDAVVLEHVSCETGERWAP